VNSNILTVVGRVFFEVPTGFFFRRDCFLCFDLSFIRVGISFRARTRIFRNPSGNGRIPLCKEKRLPFFVESGLSFHIRRALKDSSSPLCFLKDNDLK